MRGSGRREGEEHKKWWEDLHTKREGGEEEEETDYRFTSEEHTGADLVGSPSLFAPQLNVWVFYIFEVKDSNAVGSYSPTTPSGKDQLEKQWEMKHRCTCEKLHS